MTDKDILRMAHDAELTDSDLGEWMVDYGYSKGQIKKFAELVAAAEREACANVCESEWATDAERAFGGELAALIRARSAKLEGKT